MARQKGSKNKLQESEIPTIPATPITSSESALLERLAELERRDEENQKKLKMLYEVADKGRVNNYENSQPSKKPLQIKLSRYADGVIVGWRTVRDELIKHPTTGLVVGENQEYELIILDDEGKTQKKSVLGYPAFSNARYNERIEAEIIAKSEGYEGSITYDVKLDDGRIIKLGAQFVN